MENNTVIISLERYHELQVFEKAYIGKKPIIIYDYTDYLKVNHREIYLTEENKLLKETAEEINELRSNLNICKTDCEVHKAQIRDSLICLKSNSKKWWQIWK